MWSSFIRLTFLGQKIQVPEIPIPTSHKMREGALYPGPVKGKMSNSSNSFHCWRQEESQQELPRSCSYQISFSSSVPGL